MKEALVNQIFASGPLGFCFEGFGGRGEGEKEQLHENLKYFPFNFPILTFCKNHMVEISE